MKAIYLLIILCIVPILAYAEDLKIYNNDDLRSYEGYETAQPNEEMKGYEAPPSEKAMEDYWAIRDAEEREYTKMVEEGNKMFDEMMIKSGRSRELKKIKEAELQERKEREQKQLLEEQRYKIRQMQNQLHNVENLVEQ